VTGSLGRQLERAKEAAASLTGKRFGLLVASSLVATSAIVAAAMTSSSGSGPLAALLGRSLAAESTPVASAPAARPEAIAGSAGESARQAPEASAAPAAAPLPAAAPAPAPEPVPPSEPEAPPPAPEAQAPEAGQIKHVFVVSLASSGYEAAFGSSAQMPYLAGTLRPQGDLLSNYSLLDEAALPNSIAAISGQPPTVDTRGDCPDYGACVYSAETLTLADQLGIAQFTWHGYIEDMVDPLTGEPRNCVYPQPGSPPEDTLGDYAARLNPFPYFHSLLDLGDCASDDVPLTELEGDLRKADSTPNFSYVSPNLCNAGISGQCAGGAPDGAAAADAFLAGLVPKILASPAYRQDGLLIVAFGQLNAAAPPDPAAAPTDPLKVGALLVSPFITGGSTDAADYNPYSLLRSIEDLFGLTPLEKAAGAKVKSFGASLRGGETSAGD
jgi:hypothetical protein